MKLNEAVEIIKTVEMPALTGSEKQITWANTIRQSYLDSVRGDIAKSEASGIATAQNYTFKTLVTDAIIHLTHRRTAQASYWIDERNDLR